MLAGDTFMPGMNLRQSGSMYDVFGTFRKNKGKIQKFKETRDSRCIYQNERDKSFFQHDMDYLDFEDLARRTASDKVLHDKTFYIAKKSKIRWISTLASLFLQSSKQKVCWYFHSHRNNY